MFSNNLKELRKKEKITQIEFAKVLNVANGTVGNWESGTREPDFKTLIKIAKHFNVSIDSLLGNESFYNEMALSSNEVNLVTAYRAHPEMHEAVHRILGIEEAVPGFRLVAYGGDNVDNDTPTEPRIT